MRSSKLRRKQHRYRDQNMRIVIIGSGIAGYATAKEVRKLNEEAEITIITKDNGEYYSKPVLSYALSQNKTPDNIPLATADKMADELQCSIITNTAVMKIDSIKQQVYCEDSQVIDYDKLILAVGALPRVNIHTDKIMSINDLSHYRKLRDILKKDSKVGVIGSGLVGTEFASDLNKHGCKVTMFSKTRYPLDGFIPDFAGKILLEKLESNHIDFIQIVEDVKFDESSEKVNVQVDGQSYDFDIVIVATGLISNTKLAQETNLVCNHKGIEVNAYLETSEPNIYALGDCITINNHVFRYVQPINLQSRIVASNVVNGNTTKITIPSIPTSAKISCCPTAFAIHPDFSIHDKNGKWNIISSNKDGLEAHFTINNEILGFVALGDKVMLRRELAAKIRKFI